VLKTLEVIVYTILISTVISLGSSLYSDYDYFFITSFISLSFSFILSLTQGFFKRYSKTLIAYFLLLLIVVIFEFNTIASSLTLILLNLLSSVFCLSFYYIEKDRKQEIENNKEKEQDNAPFIISNPSYFEINEKDFEVNNQED
ncbi:MAG: hypothetical protein PHN41_04690, partial [Bacteroidales bacterium]|nr:hypothetical protein [Bacteroidales bacterium]